jgi:hypothetical protein
LGQELAYQQKAACSPQWQILHVGRSVVLSAPRECPGALAFCDLNKQHRWSSRKGAYYPKFAEEIGQKIITLEDKEKLQEMLDTLNMWV